MFSEHTGSAQPWGSSLPPDMALVAWWWGLTRPLCHHRQFPPATGSASSQTWAQLAPCLELLCRSQQGGSEGTLTPDFPSSVRPD